MKKHRLSVFVVLAGIGYAAYGMYGFFSEQVPRLEANLRDKEAQLSGKNSELRRLRSFSENIEGVKLSLRELNLQLESAIESMPRNYDLSGLLRKLSIIGFNSGIELSAFRPSNEPGKGAQFYETSPVSFTLTGSFTQILSFFDQALRLKRVMRIEKVTMRSTASSSNAV
ncbi:type 4a pilus biogenesis protein PilO, partial [bacterium]|nr:type 4a pilus biogenesis protein PilO [bacterium]